MEENYTYILECADGSLYTGWTNHLPERLCAHQKGTGGKYTRVRRPVKLVYYETFPTKREAMSREWHIKRLPRLEKQQLLQREMDREKQDYIQYCNDYTKQFHT